MTNYGNSSLTLNVCPEVPGLVPKGLKLIISSKPHSNIGLLLLGTLWDLVINLGPWQGRSRAHVVPVTPKPLTTTLSYINCEVTVGLFAFK